MKPLPSPLFQFLQRSGLSRLSAALGLPGLTGLSLSTRLHAGFALVLLLIAIVGALSWVQTGRLLDKLVTVTNEDFRRAELTFEMQASIDATILSVNKMAHASDPEDLRFEATSLLESRQRYAKAAAELAQSLDGSSATQALTESYQRVKKGAADAGAALDEFARLAQGGAAAGADLGTASANVEGPQDIWIKSLADLRQVVAGIAHASTEDARSFAVKGRVFTAVFVLAALCLGVVAAMLISRSITVPLGDAVALSRRVAAGDLSVELRADRRDEIGALQGSLAEMQASLRRLLGEIGECAGTIHVASAEVAGDNAQLAQRTEQTTDTLQRAAASLAGVTATVHEGWVFAGQANELAASASAVAQRGGEAVREVHGSMADIQQASRRISDIIGVIDDIAYRTNILALNAAVEAARAGEHGRGFAVVANEVRGLSARSAVAAKEIATLIQTTAQRVASGTQRVAEAGRAMDQIVAAVAEVREVIGQVSRAAAGQNEGVGEVNASVGELERMTAQNEALVKAGAQASQSLQDLSQRLNGLVAAFQLGGGAA